MSFFLKNPSVAISALTLLVVLIGIAMSVGARDATLERVDGDHDTLIEMAADIKWLKEQARSHHHD